MYDYFALHTVFETSISIIRGPEDTNATVGVVIPCYCRYIGTDDLPLWRINNVLHSTNALPPGYTANQTGIFFQAHQELHLSTYQCLFLVYSDSTERIRMIESSNGTVFVSQGQLCFLCNKVQSTTESSKQKLARLLYTSGALE